MAIALRKLPGKSQRVGWGQDLAGVAVGGAPSSEGQPWFLGLLWALSPTSHLSHCSQHPQLPHAQKCWKFAFFPRSSSPFT